MKGVFAGIVGLLCLAWHGAGAQETAADPPPEWYTAMLRSLDEPDLFKRRDNDACRVVVFGGTSATRAIRIDDSGDDLISVVSALRKDGGLESVQAFRLDPRVREYLTLSFDGALSIDGSGGFWEWPTADPSPPRIDSGYTVVLERVRDGRYHAVIRVNPDGFSGFSTAYRSLFLIHNIPVPEDARARPGPQFTEWHERIILSMEEPDLAETGREDEAAFRLTVLTRTDTPLTIRFQRSGDEFEIVVRRSSGKGWRADRSRLVALANEVGQGTPEAAEIYRRTGVPMDTRSLSAGADDWGHLQDLLAGVDFWSRHQPGQRIQRGDAMWVFEGADRGRYQILERPIDNPDPYYAAIADLMLTLAGEAE